MGSSNFFFQGSLGGWKLVGLRFDLAGSGEVGDGNGGGGCVEMVVVMAWDWLG